MWQHRGRLAGKVTWDPSPGSEALERERVRERWGGEGRRDRDRDRKNERAWLVLLIG